MNRHLFQIILLAAMLLPSSAIARVKADIRNIWIEAGTVKEGKQGLTIHADLDMSDVKGKLIGCQAMFYSRPGGWSLRDTNGKYRLSPSLNYVAAFDYFKPDVKDANHNVAIFIPVEELHMKGTHKYRIYIQLSLYSNPGKNGDFLAESDFYPVIIDMTDANNPKAIADHTASVSIAEARLAAQSPEARMSMTPTDKPDKKKDKKNKKEREKEKKEKKEAKKVKSHGSEIEKEAIDPEIFWEKVEVDSASLPKLYIEDLEED